MPDSRKGPVEGLTIADILMRIAEHLGIPIISPSLPRTLSEQLGLPQSTIQLALSSQFANIPTPERERVISEIANVGFQRTESSTERVRSTVYDAAVFSQSALNGIYTTAQSPAMKIVYEPEGTPGGFETSRAFVGQGLTAAQVVASEGIPAAAVRRVILFHGG